MAAKSKKSAKLSAKEAKALSPMLLTQLFSLFGSGGNDLGDPVPVSAAWAPNHIRYYKLGLQTSGGLQFTYAEETGVAIINDDPINFETNVERFVDSVVAGTPDVVPFSQNESAPDFVAKKACYIVIELDAALKWRFACRSPAIKTVNDCKDIYFGLQHVDTYGKRWDGQNKSPKNVVCRIAYFGVNLGARASAQINPTEKFSIFVESERGFQDCVKIILDPDIRNDGGTNPGFFDIGGRGELAQIGVARKKSRRS